MSGRDPDNRLCVGVMGAGAIGCYIGGRLLERELADVVFIGRERLRADTAEHGLTVQDFGGGASTVPPERIAFCTEPAGLAECDVVLCCVKSAQTEDVGASMNDVLGSDAIVVSMQNGIRNADALRATLGGRTVLPAIVGYNVVWKDGAVFQRTTTGPLHLEACDDPRAIRLVDALRAAGNDVVVKSDIAPDQWAKLIINLNNSVSALSGAPTRDLVLRPGYRRTVTAVMREGLRVLRAAGIRPAKMKGVPMGLLTRAMSLPTFMVRLVARAQMKIDPDARSSMYQDLARGRLTEVEYLNGEIVQLAERSNADAPLNRRIVELVHQAEQAGTGSPGLDPDALWAALKARG